jgi:hypothetical protein
VLESSVVLDATLLPQPRPEHTEPWAGGVGSGAGRLLPLSPWYLPRLSGSCSTAASVCKSMRAPAQTANEAVVHALASPKPLAGAAKSTAKTVLGRPQEPAAEVAVFTEQMAAKKRPREHLLSEPPQAVDGSHGTTGAGASASEWAKLVRRKRGEDEKGDAKGVGVESEMKVEEEVQGERARKRAEDLHGVRRYSKPAAARGGGGGGGTSTFNSSSSSGTGNQSGGIVCPPVEEAVCEDATARRRMSQTKENRESHEPIESQQPKESHEPKEWHEPKDKHKGSAKNATPDAAVVEATVEAATVLLAKTAAAENESGVGGNKRRTRASVAQGQQSKKPTGCRGPVTRRGGVRGGVWGGRSEHIGVGVPRATTQQSEKVIMVCGSEAERKQLAAAIVTLGGATSVSSHYFDMDATHVLTTRHKNKTEKSHL